MARCKKIRNQKSNFLNQLESVLDQERQRIQPKLEEEERKEKRQLKADAARRRLRENQKQDPDNIRAASVILQWTANFIATEEFTTLKELSALRAKEKFGNMCPIYKTIIISAEISDQGLVIEIENARQAHLEVVNYFKYGCSHKVSTMAEILEHVKPELIKEVARTIEENEIEYIILDENDI